jgi:hypothetical protein
MRSRAINDSFQYFPAVQGEILYFCFGSTPVVKCLFILEAAIEQAKVNQETITDLDDVLSKVNNFSVKDSRKVFMKIVEHNSVAKVQGWLDMASKPQEKAA